MAKLKVYSQAFFDVAKESNQLDKFIEEAKLVLTTLESQPDLFAILNHPETTADQKFGILKDLFGPKVSQDMLGLFNIVLTKRRESGLKDILSGFVDLALKDKNIAIARVYAPVALTSEQQTKIIQKLGAKLNKQIELETIVQPELVAGLRIIVDGAVIDASVKKQIQTIRQHLHTSAKEVKHGA